MPMSKCICILYKSIHNYIYILHYISVTIINDNFIFFIYKELISKLTVNINNC